MSPKHLKEEAVSADIRFVTQGLTPEEVAAATAVLTAALNEQAQAQTDDAHVVPPGQSEWERSARGLRRPLHGGWRTFNAQGL